MSASSRRKNKASESDWVNNRMRPAACLHVLLLIGLFGRFMEEISRTEKFEVAIPDNERRKTSTDADEYVHSHLAAVFCSNLTPSYKI